MDINIEHLKTILDLMGQYKCQSAMICSVLIIFLWKSKRAIELIIIIFGILTKQKKLDDLFSILLPLSTSWIHFGKYGIFEQKIISKDCSEMKTKLLSVLRKCRNTHETFTLSMTNIIQVSPQAISAFEFFIHSIMNEYSDILIKIILPCKGQCKMIDDFGDWAFRTIENKNSQNITIVYDRYREDTQSND